MQMEICFIQNMYVGLHTKSAITYTPEKGHKLYAPPLLYNRHGTIDNYRENRALKSRPPNINPEEKSLLRSIHTLTLYAER